jgi:hypothetical protein
MSTTKKLWICLGVLALFSPLGLVIPERFKTGTAWGEWGVEEIERMLGYVPHGLQKLNELWKAPLRNYGLAGLPPGLGYVLSAFLGAGGTILLVWLLGRVLVQRNGKREMN